MTEPAHADRAHARLSASGSSIWLNCQQSAVLSKELERRSSVWADEGTRAHEVAETILRGHQPAQDVPEEMIKNVEPYVRTVLDITSRAKVAHIERKLSLSGLWFPERPPEDLFGTVDFYAVVGSTLHVVDLKYGKYHVVEVTGSTQLRFYALAAYLDLSPADRVAVDWIVMTIVQPRAPHEDGPVRSWSVSVLDLLDWGYDEVTPTVEAIVEERTGLTLQEGPWCRWCPAQMQHCPLKLASKGDKARETFDELV